MRVQPARRTDATVGTAVINRTLSNVRQRELLSVTVYFCAAQAQGAAVAQAKKTGLANAVDAVRAFVRGCSVHYQRAVHRLLLDGDGTDNDLYARVLGAPSTITTVADANTLLTDLSNHLL